MMITHNVVEMRNSFKVIYTIIPLYSYHHTTYYLLHTVFINIKAIHAWAQYKRMYEINTESLSKCQVPELLNLRLYHVLRNDHASSWYLSWYVPNNRFCFGDVSANLLHIFVMFYGSFSHHVFSAFHPYSFVDMVASNHTIKLVNISTGPTGTYYTILALTIQVNTRNNTWIWIKAGQKVFRKLTSGLLYR